MEICLFQNKKGEYEELYSFLEAVDEDFFPALSKYPYPFREHLDRVVEKGTIFYIKEETVIGMISFYDHDERFESAYIDLIAVLKEHRKKNLGMLLMEKCFSELKSKNIKKVRIRTWSTNPASKKLYEKAGFKVYKTEKDDRGKGVDSVYFEKELLQ
ncbi:MAG: GNAT family N-acetyltransferase [bacterium]|nr:GNAT family N-acetyltransferase [bacterium]